MPQIERPRVLRIHENDPIAVALSPLSPGDEVVVQGSSERPTVQLEDPIPFGHKIALVPIRKGQTVLKYGEPIGRATRSIRVGQHVHTHNLVGLRGRTPMREAITECEVGSGKWEVGNTFGFGSAPRRHRDRGVCFTFYVLRPLASSLRCRSLAPTSRRKHR